VTEIAGLIAGARQRVEAGELETANVIYEMVLDATRKLSTPQMRVARGEACAFRAERAARRNRLGTAADYYRMALEADPRCGDYRADYIVKVLLPMGWQKAALAEARRAVAIEPDNYRTWRALGHVAHDIGDADELLRARKRALELAPDEPNVWHDYATSCVDLGDYGGVRETCERLFQGDGVYPAQAWQLLAMVAYREGRHEDSIRLYDVAIDDGCADPSMACWNQSLPMQSLGRYKEGWRLYEFRGQQTTDPLFAVSMKRFARPLFQNEPPPARIHLHSEMGHGDCIALSRYAPLLAARGYDVRMEVSASLVSLLECSFPGVQIFEKALDYPGSTGLKDFDYHLPMLSAPAVLGTEIDTVPWDGPYLKAPPGQVSEWFRKFRVYEWEDIKNLSEGKRRKRVGLCWSSGIREGLWLKEYGRRKSMRLEKLSPLFSADAEFYSLQCGPPAQENYMMPGLTELEPDWAETAGLIEMMDLVITVDSAVAHLAGAMGKPVWVMMHTEGSWHWMTASAWGGRCATESPWYPSARLFRQQKAHEWDGVIEDVRKALCDWL
jgi:tetratricopeptide (TPR) repeat protein